MMKSRRVHNYCLARIAYPERSDIWVAGQSIICLDHIYEQGNIGADQLYVAVFPNMSPDLAG